MYTRPYHTLGFFASRLGKALILYILYVSAIYYLYNHLDIEQIDLPMSISTVLGVSVSLLLGFRTSAAYDRWWEARKVWGGIVNDSRTFVRQLIGFTSGKEVHNEVKNLSHLMIAWCYALRSSLRKLNPTEGIEKYLTDDEKEELSKHSNVPNGILKIMEEKLARLKESGAIDTYQYVAMDSTLKRLCDEMGMCERIKNTVFPVQYRRYTSHGITLFVLMLPFGMLESTGPFVILISTLVAFFFNMIEAIAYFLQDPFENRRSDTPMSTLSNTIEINILQMIRETEVPEKMTPDENGVLM